MSQQTSHENPRKNKKQLRREAIQRSKIRDDDNTSESSSHHLTPDPDYNAFRNMFDYMPGGLM